MSETAQLGEILNHLKEHDQRFDRVETKLEALESRFDEKFAGLDRKIGGLGVQLENLQSTVQMLAEQMSGFILLSPVLSNQDYTPVVDEVVNGFAE